MKMIKKIREVIEMLAMLWVTKIINGKKIYADVPRGLKSQVAEILEENDLSELITE